ncbi:hypothetical protein CPC08DRAFT_118852 [Agrocybe pediades]|nr:hypothetical protein CPC08DRAFT_118852 [Agrocybe pediades]
MVGVSVRNARVDSWCHWRKVLLFCFRSSSMRLAVHSHPLSTDLSGNKLILAHPPVFGPSGGARNSAPARVFSQYCRPRFTPHVANLMVFGSSLGLIRLVLGSHVLLSSRKSQNV